MYQKEKCLSFACKKKKERNSIRQVINYPKKYPEQLIHLTNFIQGLSFISTEIYTEGTESIYMAKVRNFKRLTTEQET